MGIDIATLPFEKATDDAERFRIVGIELAGAREVLHRRILVLRSELPQVEPKLAMHLVIPGRRPNGGPEDVRGGRVDPVVSEVISEGEQRRGRQRTEGLRPVPNGDQLIGVPGPVDPAVQVLLERCVVVSRAARQTHPLKECPDWVGGGGRVERPEGRSEPQPRTRIAGEVATVEEHSLRREVKGQLGSFQRDQQGPSCGDRLPDAQLIVNVAVRHADIGQDQISGVQLAEILIGDNSRLRKLIYAVRLPACLLRRRTNEIVVDGVEVERSAVGGQLTNPEGHDDEEPGHADDLLISSRDERRGMTCPSGGDEIAVADSPTEAIWNMYSALAPPSSSQHSYRRCRRLSARTRRETRCMTPQSSAATSSAATSSNAATPLLHRAGHPRAIPLPAIRGPARPRCAHRVFPV